jgi:hypothetical protein
VGTNGHTLVANSSTSTGLEWKVDPVADLVTTAGDTLYATAADTLVRLGIGTAGQVLQVNSGATAPEWATPAGASGLTLISTTSFSAVASQSVNSCFSATYDNYLIKLNFTTIATTNNKVDLRLRASGVDTTTNYRRQVISGNGTTVSGFRETSNTAMNGIGYLQTTFNNEFTFQLTNPFKTCVTSGFTNQVSVSQGNIELELHSHGLNDTTSYDGFTLLVATTITGSVSVYGYNK